MQSRKSPSQGCRKYFGHLLERSCRRQSSITLLWLFRLGPLIPYNLTQSPFDCRIKLLFEKEIMATAKFLELRNLCPGAEGGSSVSIMQAVPKAKQASDFGGGCTDHGTLSLVHFPFNV